MMLQKADFHRPPAPRVLVVEDNTLIAMDLEDILKTFGCQVVGPSVSVTEALTLLANESVDVAVVDYLLEDGTAAPFLNVLNDKGVPFAICTGAAESEIRSVYPHTAILAKPYTPEDVSLMVNSLVASRLANA